MRTVLKDGAEVAIQDVWDGHGKSQWTYFAERVKQHIAFYLSKRLRGRNLDLGGGWYSHYSDSDIVDVSPVCLDYNVAPRDRKRVLDLDDASVPGGLPFKGETFDSATMVSVWQYLRNPTGLMGELRRVLKPGGEVYIINGQGAGDDELVIGDRYSPAIYSRLQRLGYMVFVEGIPDSSGGTQEFQSVCVKMPGADGKLPKKFDKPPVCGGARRFVEEFADAEKALYVDRLEQLREYPVTKYSVELRGKIEGFTRDYVESTGSIPIVFMSHSVPYKFDMSLPYSPPSISTLVLKTDDEKLGVDTHAFLRKHGIGSSTTVGHLRHDRYESLLDAIRRPDESDRRYLADFAGDVKVNSKAVELGDAIEDSFKKTFNGIFRMERAKALSLYLQCSQHKQRRHIDEAIEMKRSIMGSPELIDHMARLDFDHYAQYFKSLILGEHLSDFLGMKKSVYGGF